MVGVELFGVRLASASSFAAGLLSATGQIAEPWKGGARWSVGANIETAVSAMETLERFLFDVNRNCHGGVPASAQIRFECSAGGGGMRWRRATRKTCGSAQF